MYISDYSCLPKMNGTRKQRAGEQGIKGWQRTVPSGIFNSEWMSTYHTQSCTDDFIIAVYSSPNSRESVTKQLVRVSNHLTRLLQRSHA